MKHAIETKEEAQAQVREISERLAEIQYNKTVRTKKEGSEPEWETGLNRLNKKKKKKKL